jgi:large subunit ribosomal protein L23
MRTDSVILQPIITEKSVAEEAQNKKTFWVNRLATKSDVVAALVEFYKIKPEDVKKVNIVNLPAKFRLAGKGRTITRRPEAKKAIVTLHAGKKLDYNAFK